MNLPVGSLVPPACITPKGAGGSPDGAQAHRSGPSPTTESASGESCAVQPDPPKWPGPPKWGGPPKCSWNAATNTASQHTCEGPGALQRYFLPVGRRPLPALLAADPGPTCPGILVPPLEPLRRGCPLYNLVVVGPRIGQKPPQGGGERPTTSRFGTFSTPTCCPESSPS